MSATAPSTDAERDLAAAGHLQRLLLPPSPITIGPWEIAHAFLPAGVVSGDYVGIQPHGERVYFMIGDVSGKGVAASLLMAQLHAMFRTMIPLGFTLEELMTRASALLCASSLPAQYATMVAGYLEPTGTVVVSNAGHPPPRIISADQRGDVRATGTPLGMFCQSEFSSTQLTIGVGETLFAFTDGLFEATNAAGDEYGLSRAAEAASAGAHRSAHDLVDAVLADQRAFRGDEPDRDDVTLLAIRRR